MKHLILLLLPLHLYLVILQSKGGVRTKTTIECTDQYHADQLAKQLFPNQHVISVTTIK